jgi:hypothetical protein
MLPNLIVIGAAKCGTTSLHWYLGSHPEITMSQEKELNYFVAEERWSRGLDWYESQFRESRVRGESSPDYTAYPHFVGVPSRMAATVPDAKLIYLVRDPVERIVSQYRFRRWVTKGETCELDAAVRDFDRSLYVALSSYAMQLEQYLEHFAPERILVLDQADLRLQREDTLRRAFHFLDVDESFGSRGAAHEYNPTEGPRSNTAGRGLIRVLDATVGRQRSAQIQARTPHWLVRPLLRIPEVAEVQLDPVLRAELIAYLKPDTDRLRTLTGQPFAGWCT